MLAGLCAHPGARGGVSYGTRSSPPVPARSLITLVETLALLVPLLLCVAYLTVAERKVLGAMQLRKGPNVVGFWGIFCRPLPTR